MNLYEALDQIGRKTAQEFWELWKREHARRPEAEARAWVDKWAGPLAGRTKQERRRAMELRVVAKLRAAATDGWEEALAEEGRKTFRLLSAGKRAICQQVADVVEFGP